jgi:hypothetical protein
MLPLRISARVGQLLPLRRGDHLIVDMSPATVRAGGTDPREVEKLIRRGVRVFTRRHLHAKTIVVDRTTISRSANVSKRSQQQLDEAAILTNDPSTVRRAREFIERLSTEPVLPEYLEKCKQLYRPPCLNDRLADGNNMQRRTKHAKLWVVNLREYPIPDSEADRYHQGEVKAEESAHPIPIVSTGLVRTKNPICTHWGCRSDSDGTSCAALTANLSIR